MKESKAVSITKQELRHIERLYDVYINKIQDVRRPYVFSKDIGCQYDVKRNVTCTCQKRRDMYFSGLPKQVYAYHGTRSVTDVGVGSVKALQRKRVRRIYLPETDDRGIGSEDLSVFVTRRTKPIPRSGYLDQKKTSSKCVGGIIKYNTGCVLNEKLSPIVQTKSGATSPSDRIINTEVASNTIGKDMVTNTTQFDIENERSIQDNAINSDSKYLTYPKTTNNNPQKPTCSKYGESIAVENFEPKAKQLNRVDKGISSDSLVQHVHDLEIPSDLKESRTSIDILENKLEIEYRKIFSTKRKDKRSNERIIPDMKRPSMLRRRFEALRRGTVKKDDSKKNTDIINKESNQPGTPIRKDVSIASDPPSLEGRSYSNTKTYSPFPFNNEPEKSSCKPSTSRKKSSTENTDKTSLQWPQIVNDESDCQGVKGMFKLWGKKFNLEEESYTKRSTTLSSHQIVNTFKKQPDKKAELKLEKTVKKDGKKFFFFKKRSKEKSKPYKSKKGLTAGRCEVGDGLTIKIDGNTFIADETKKQIQISKEILRTQWLHKYLSHAIESKNSVQIRWNNKTYATSSSTIFELMDTVYQDAGIVFGSKSEVTTGESSFYRSRTQHVNFAHQEIEAWMIPKTVMDSPKQICKKFKGTISKDNTQVRMSAQKWFIDKAKAFSRKIEVVLHTKHVVRTPKESSSEYLRIDIPKGFFIESSSDENRKPSSDEEVYKIIEYETESDSKENKKDTGDADDVGLIIQKGSQDFKPHIFETVIKGPVSRRDVVIQGSDVNIPKRCDVIGVGIITQRDLSYIRKPILKIQDYLTAEETDANLIQNPKKCGFAESYLQDYYRHWIPLGIDFFSWCVSDSQLRCNSENSEGSYYNQGDGSKSCPNIYDDFQTSAIVSSNNGCDPCNPGQIVSDYEEIKPSLIENYKCKWLKKLKIKKSRVDVSAKRVLPKDSLEVFKRRKIYAASDKSKWKCPSHGNVKPYSVPSIEAKEAQGLTADTSKSTVASRAIEPRHKPHRKHVSMKKDGTYEYISNAEGSPAGILMFKGASGCDVCKEAAGICPKHATVDPVSCEIPDPPCRPVCLDDLNPPCSPVNPLPRKKQDLPPVQNNNIEPPTADSIETINPPCLTLDNIEKVPPCQKCRSFMKESSPNIGLYNDRSPTDARPPTNRNLPTATKSPTDTNTPTETNLPSKKASILCPHFPSCRKSQSCQKSGELLQNFPEQYPEIQHSDNEAKKSPVCVGPPCVVEKKNKETGETAPHSSRGNTRERPPDGSDKYPWPLKSQRSDQSAQDLAVNLEGNKIAIVKSTSCNKDCPFSPKYSTQTKDLKKRSEVKCKVNCGSIIDGKLSKAPSPPIPSIPNTPLDGPTPYATPLKETQSPLHLPVDPAKNKTVSSSKPNLKSQPSNKKVCSNECSALGNYEGKGNVIRLNSKENICIRMKKPTPSTEEIREAMNIKVKDDDGNTLYERIDYRKSCKSCRSSRLGDMYKSSEVNRCSTPITIKNVQTSQEREKIDNMYIKSDSSIANLVEIQFKIKITQGDKTTQLNIGKNKNSNQLAQIKKSEISPTPQDIFVVKDDVDNLCSKQSPKNDVNIRIVIKNFKSKRVKRKTSKSDDDFAQNISNKFHTVSTGYSDVYTGQKLDHVFSVHRATTDLTTSNEELKTQTRPSENKSEIEFTDKISKITTSTNKIKLSHSASKKEKINVDEKSFVLCKEPNNEDVEDFQSYLPDQEVRASLYTDSEDQDNFGITTSNADSDKFIEKPLNKEQKKELLKRVMEKAYKTKNKTKGRIKHLSDMLKVILTSDSSGHDEIAVTSNELLKDVTFESLRPNFCNEMDSMNTSYNIGSTVSLGNENVTNYYPSKEQNSECSRSEEDPVKIDNELGCMCSTFAERLNLCGLSEGRCCCRSKQIKSEETSCDIKPVNNILFMNLKTAELVDVETQPSMYSSSRPVSANYFIRSETTSNTIENKPAGWTHFEELTAKYTLPENTVMHAPKDIVSCKYKEINKKTLNRNIALNLSDEDRAVLLKATPTNVYSGVKKTNNEGKSKNDRKPHILQSYATKKAVLEIYTEKTMEKDGEHAVANLPKFVYDKENEIRRYQEKLCHYNNVCKRNVVMMSVER